MRSLNFSRDAVAAPAPSRAFAAAGSAALVVNFGLFCLLLVMSSGSPFSGPWEGVVGSLVMVVPTASCFVYAWRGGPRRKAALWLGAGMLCWAAGNVIFVGWTQFQEAPPVPSPADYCYLAFYICIAVTMVSLSRAEMGKAPWSLWLDGALGAAGAATVFAAALNSVLTRPAGDFSHVLVGAGYTVADLVLVATICGLLAVRGTSGGSTWLWLAGGLAVFCTADVVYALQVTSESFAIGTVLNALWTGGITILAFALWRPVRQRRPGAVRSAAVLAVPLTATFAAVVVMVIATTRPTSVIVVGLATGTLLLAVVRTFVSFRQVSELAVTRRQAVSDDLTGLGNRRYLYECGEQRLSARSKEERIALMMIDLDSFKKINDAHGHQVGDEVLREVSLRLAARVAAPDMVIRLGGDEFALLLVVKEDDQASDLAQRILTRISRPYATNGLSLQINASIGIAEAQPEIGITELLRRGDLAMYSAKAGRSRVALYDTKLDAANQARLETLNDLDAAFVHHQFVLHYQPKVAVQTGAIVGAEALVRWQHPTRGLLPPDAFLPIVEQGGVMSLLTRQVLEQAVTQVAAWRKSGLMLVVAVNLSASDLLGGQLVREIIELLAEHDVPANCLELEITESVLMSDPVQARAVLDALRQAGLGISVDDYGTGYSSLAYLRDLPVDELKIDRSFVARIAGDPRSAAIVTSTIELAHALGLTVVGEGVETEQTRRVLSAAGCDLVQGFLFSRPLPAEDFEAWARARAPDSHPLPTTA